MPKFQVIITRDITESTFIEVEAETADKAEDLALRQLWRQTDTVWEVDDGPADGPAYVSDVSPME